MASAAYAQGSVKRQKLRETSRASDSFDYFQGIDKIEYNNMASTTDTMVYRYYNQGERLHGRTMEEWIKYSVSLTAFKCNGPFTDKYGKPQSPWDDNTNTVENCKRQIKACFELCHKLGVKHWTAFDTDLVPWSANLEEWRGNVEEMTEYVQEMMQKMHLKMLWLAPDLHTHTRYASGACTSNDANVFLQSATQVKRALEMAQKLNAECFLIWPLREGYNSLYETDVSREIKLFAQLLKMLADYKERLLFRGHFLIMPYCDAFENGRVGGDGVNRYVWDAASCCSLLRYFKLERFFKVYAKPDREMCIIQFYNMLGGITINDQMHEYQNRTLTLMMKYMVEQGASPPGGTNARVSRAVAGVGALAVHTRVLDALAKALRVAANLVSEQMFAKHTQQRYVSYCSGPGSKVLSGELTLENCEEYTKKNLNQYQEMSRPEHWEAVFQRYLDKCEHV